MKTRDDTRSLGLLVFFVALFCIKFYGGDRFIFQGDVFMNLYLHGNPGSLYGGWDTHMLYYPGWFPVSGAYFPLRMILHGIVSASEAGPHMVLGLLKAHAALSMLALSLTAFMFYRSMGLSYRASSMGSVIVSYTGFHVHMGMLEFDSAFLESFACVFGALYCMARALGERRIGWAVASGFLTGLSLLAGVNQPMLMWLPLLPFTGLLWPPVTGGAERWWRNVSRCLLYSTIACVAAAISGAAVVLPSVAYMSYSARDILVEAQLRSNLFSLYDTLMTMLFRDWWLHGVARVLEYHELDSFLGLPVMMLAAYGAVAAYRLGKRRAVFMLIAAGYAIVIMHAAWLPSPLNAPLIELLRALSIRSYFRFFMVLLIPVAYFAACGLDALLDGSQASKRQKPLVYIFIVSFVAYGYFAYAFWQDGILVQTSGSFLISQALLLSFSLIFFAVMLYQDRFARRRGIISVAMVVLVFFFYLSARPGPELPSRTNYTIHDINDDTFWAPLYPLTVDETIDAYYNSPLGLWPEVLGDRSAPFRVWDKGPVAFTSLWAPRLDADMAFNAGLDPGNPRQLYLYQFLILDPANSPMTDLFNVRYLHLPGYAGDRLIPTAMQDVYYNPGAFARFFIVHGAEYFRNDDELFMSMGFASRDRLAHNAFLISPEHVGTRKILSEEKSGDRVDILDHEPTRTVLDVTMSGDGMLIASEPWFPAWSVVVDGADAGIARADGAFQGVWLKQGRHRVEFRYSERITLIGVLISWGSLIAGAIYAILFYRRSKKAV